MPGKRWAFILLALSAFAPRAEATSVAHVSDADLFTMADVVMVANVWRWHVPEDTDITEYELEALECFKGCTPGQFLLMGTPGVAPGRAPGVREVMDGMPVSEVGDRIIVHLLKTDIGLYSLISLGLSQYTLRYNPSLHRFIAHREVDSIAVFRPTMPGREADSEVLVPRDVFASDVIENLRTRAKGR